MAEFRDRDARLEAVLARAERELLTALRRAARETRAELSVVGIRALLERGRIEEVDRRYALHLAAVVAAAQAAVLSSGRSAAAEIAAQTGRARFLDQSDPRLAGALRDEGRRLLSGLADAQRAATREALGEALRDGDGLDEQARSVWDSIGATAAHVRAARAHLRRMLLERPSRDTGRDAFAFAPGVRPDEESPPEDRPADRGQARRSASVLLLGSAALGLEALALDSAQATTNLGLSLALAQAEDDGVLEDVEFVWSTARDERVRRSHRFMEGQVRPEGEPFRSGDGNQLRFPGDPDAPASDRVRCRCLRRARAGVAARPAVA